MQLVMWSSHCSMSAAMLLSISLAWCVATNGVVPPTPPTRLIIDTDMSGDCDDVGALCVAHALVRRGEADLVAVVHNTGLDTGVGAISAINNYYGRQDVLVGAYKGAFDWWLRGPYVDDVVSRFPGPIRNSSQAQDAVTVYRTALASSPDKSVWISSIGFTTNLEALLASPADSISPLDGRALVEAKVKGIAWMGGRYPASVPGGSPTMPSPEHNFGFNGIGRSTANTLAAWPPSVPITFLGFEVGVAFGTGGVMTNHTPPTNPCRQAYIDHSGEGNDRFSWDPATTLFAVRGTSDFYTEHGTGHNEVGQDGNNRWVDTGVRANQSYLILKSNASAQFARDAINTLLIAPP